MEHGTIFNIQKFSVNDGPGIRTVVFFKGCPLRCGWCANPESQRIQPQLLWNEKRCRRCGSCVQRANGAIRFVGDTMRIDHAAIAAAIAMVQACPGRALSVEGKVQTVEDVMAVVRQDMAFYEESGGGMTLSGGEILAQPAFALALLKAAKHEGIDTCVETTGFGKATDFQALLAYTDHVFIDYKHVDLQAHKQGTGQTNEVIEANLRYALASKKPVVVRIPVIPGFNDSLDDARAIASRLKALGATQVQLLPFHQFGENKYASLTKDYAFAHIDALREEDLIPYQEILIQSGLDAFF